MMKIKVYSVLLDIGWKGWDDDDMKNLLNFILNSEGYEAKILRIPVYPWKEIDCLDKVKKEIDDYTPDVIIYYFNSIISFEAILFLSEILKIYQQEKYPVILALNGHQKWYPPEGFEFLIDGHLSIPFGPENLLRAIEYILKKDKNGKMLHL